MRFAVYIAIWGLWAFACSCAKAPDDSPAQNMTGFAFHAAIAFTLLGCIACHFG